MFFYSFACIQSSDQSIQLPFSYDLVTFFIAPSSLHVILNFKLHLMNNLGHSVQIKKANILFNAHLHIHWARYYLFAASKILLILHILLKMNWGDLNGILVMKLLWGSAKVCSIFTRRRISSTWISNLRIYC